ncbi:MAG: SAM-dependent methyltransferase [Candidatus Micrarchaeaceae archaeon]
MKYFIYGSPIFLKSNISNMKNIFGNFKVESNFVNSYIISAHEASLKDKNEIKFLYRILKIIKYGEISEKNYLDDIKNILERTTIPNKKLRLECIDINSRRGYSAKDIEVYLGEYLEKKGAKVTLKNPEILCYIILFDMKCYIGFISYKKLKFIDPGRYYKKLSSGISRAEFKLMEVFDEFKIISKEGQIAFDLGASPGGWSVFLAKNKIKTIAIDQGEMISDKIKALKLTYLEINDLNTNKLNENNIQILHIKKKFQDSLNILNKYKKVDFITCDMNISPKDAANAVLLFSKNLKKKGKLIFTVKCKTKFAYKYVTEAKEVLSENFNIKKIIALPNNRQELTLYGIKK